MEGSCDGTEAGVLNVDSTLVLQVLPSTFFKSMGDPTELQVMWVRTVGAGEAR